MADTKCNTDGVELKYYDVFYSVKEIAQQEEEFRSLSKTRRKKGKKFGRLVSLNEFYSTPHYRTREAIVKEYHSIFLSLLGNIEVPKLNKYSLEIYYKGRSDVDNISAMGKMFADVLKDTVAIDDRPKYYKGMSIFYDDTMESNTLLFRIVSHGNLNLKPKTIWQLQE